MAEATYSSLPSLSSNSLSPRPSTQQTPEGNPEFVSVDDKYRCVVCTGVVRDAVQTQCGHRGCEQCLKQLLQDSPEPVRCPAREDSYTILKDSEIYRDFGARREVRLLPVYCTYKTSGCEETVAWKDLQKHEANCDYKPSKCKYSGDGCQATIIKKELQNHEQTCQFRKEGCRYCLQEIQHYRIQEHLQTSCQEFEIPCPFQCGIRSAPRKTMIEHYTRECPKRLIECKYKRLGCNFTGSQDTVNTHTRSEIDHHLELSALRSAELGLVGVQAKERTQELNGKIAELQSLITENVTAMNELKESLSSLKRTIKDVKLKVVAQTERLITVERKVENLADKETQNALGREMVMLKEKQSIVETRVTQLERAGPSGGNNGGFGFTVTHICPYISLFTT